MADWSVRRRIVSQPVVRAAAVAEREVQQSIRAERDRARIVVELWLVDAKDDALRLRIDPIGSMTPALVTPVLAALDPEFRND